MNKMFKSLESYEAKNGNNTTLLPFKFSNLDSQRYILSNFAGEYLILHKMELQKFIRHQLPTNSETYNKLKSKHFFIDGDSSVAIDLLATKYRTKQSFLSQFTSLFMFVTTLRCDHSCIYCQVSRQPKDKAGYDMTEPIADKAIEFMFRSPSPTIKVEFQGGESLLHFDMVKYIVLKAKEINQTESRDLEFVITSNLSALTDEMLEFCFEHDLFISTSLDGPLELHNQNRPQPNKDSYKEAIRGIQRVKEALGPSKISALMTTTGANLSQPKEIIDEYVKQGFSSIFLRVLNPYGKAASNNLVGGYAIDKWLNFYHEALSHIINLNYQGIYFCEEFAALILRKMLTPYPTGFVDLQSPAGIGISGIVFNYNGDVYPSDEARMLAEMGDTKFRLGNLLENSYEDIMLSDSLLDPLKSTMAECVPGCADCAIQPYCGSDPVRHYRTQRDLIGFKPTSDFCKKNMGIVKYLATLIEDNSRAHNVLKTWI